MMHYTRFAPMAAAAALLAVLACNTTTEPSAQTVVRASFANDKHVTLPEPGSPGCKGQTTAYVAQYGKNNAEALAELGIRIRGFSAFANLAELSNQEVHDEIETYCNTPV